MNRAYDDYSSAFGIAFDIDGVVLRGHRPIGGSNKALRRLYADSTSSGINLSTAVKMSIYKNGKSSRHNPFLGFYKITSALSPFGGNS